MAVDQKIERVAVRSIGKPSLYRFDEVARDDEFHFIGSQRQQRQCSPTEIDQWRGNGSLRTHTEHHQVRVLNDARNGGNGGRRGSGLFLGGHIE